MRHTAPLTLYTTIALLWTSCLVSEGQGPTPSDDSTSLTVVSPSDGAVLNTSLTATLRWTYPTRKNHNGLLWFDYPGVTLRVSRNKDMSKPFLNVDLPEDKTCYRLAVVPQTDYYWHIIPRDERGLRLEKAAAARFTTGSPRIETTADDSVRYRNPRVGAHWRHHKPIEFGESEPLSPWYEVKSYVGPPMPRFEDIKPLLPVPVYDGRPDSIDAYWYCWKTLMSVWYFSPETLDHQAVANICGIRSWGPWGSTMVFDTAFILHFARYGHQAYPFVTAFDNCYARQHENGFICRETDRGNHEVYVWFPVNPPLFAWAEWEWYKITGDRQRLIGVLLPIVKHYEWFMTYMRRENGLYWTRGEQEADDSPRNALMHCAVSATSYQALSARCLSLMAAAVGRDDLRAFFDAEHRKLGEIVNSFFWDERNGIYNDLTRDNRFITEVEPGKLCKHVHMFWPLLAGIAPPDRVARILRELRNPASFGRRSGIPSLSADSVGYNGDTGQYWRGAVWPSGQCMVQEGLRVSGHEDFARDLSEKYFRAQLEVFRKEGTIKENMAPDKPQGHGVADFVGWGGLGPVANLFESVLGFDIDAPANTITWHITKTGRHGIENLKFHDFRVDLICADYRTPSKPCTITIRSGGTFTLKVLRAAKIKEVKVSKGDSQLIVDGQ